jgi:hypothetical protein
MRELKFRYYNAASKSMHPNVYYAIDFDGNFLMSMPLPKGAYPDKDRRFTPTELHKGDAIMQYTGLKDRKGVEIYEGDIVHEFDERLKDEIVGVYGVVYYKNGFYIDDGLHSNWNAEDVEVIGNIYENKELL